MMSEEWPTPAFGTADWTLNATETVAHGFFRLDRLHLSHAGHQGVSVGPMTRELFVREPAAVVALLDPQARACVFVEQFRIGVAASDRGESPWLMEWVAGICDTDETPEQTAIREVYEETGLTPIGPLRPVATYYPSPGGSNELIHLYFTTVDTRQGPRFRGQADEHEDLRVHVVSVDACFQALAQGRINNAATLIGLQWLQMHRHEYGL
ncbi:MAG: NUDIX domain-containing protein [Gammaproteobacteria bacterium]|nr:NUDIX domain-containing protein [Gammaproteobacteria bacterium]